MGIYRDIMQKAGINRLTQKIGETMKYSNNVNALNDYQLRARHNRASSYLAKQRMIRQDRADKICLIAAVAFIAALNVAMFVAFGGTL